MAAESGLPISIVISLPSSRFSLSRIPAARFMHRARSAKEVRR
jgi:hypothetical protein